MNRALRLRWASAAVTLAIVILTATLSWLASTVHDRTDHSLFAREVAQTATALAAEVATVQVQLVDAAEVAAQTHANPQIFDRFATPKLSARGPFASMSLWRVRAGRAREIAAVGVPQALVASHQAQSFLSHVHPSAKLFLTPLFLGKERRLGYAEMPPGDTGGLVVYAERFVPGPHPLPALAPTYGAFALYLGARPVTAALLETTAPVPLRGDLASAPIAFGDRTMILVGKRETDLGGALSADLPWVVLGVGVLLALLSGGVVEYLTRRRRLAETLAEENRQLYMGQRRIAADLQHALLPRIPAVDGLAIATRYLPGVDGTEVGGDWFDVIPLDDHRCVLVVGDVSGRGLRAAATMASLRFALRAYVLQGDPLEELLAKMGSLLDVNVDEQFATVLVAEVDTAARRLTVVSAGHLLPLIVAAGHATFMEGPIDTPIGVTSRKTTEPIVLDVPPGATLIAFTDGLVERHGEIIDTGLERLRRAAENPAADLADLVDQVVTHLASADDDTLVMGVQWTA